MSRLKDMYKNEIVDAMIKKCGYKNIMEVPKIDKVRGMDVIIVTTAKTDEEARELLRLFGMPFEK